MGKVKKTKLKETLYHTLAKHRHDKKIENKAKKHAENMEKAKNNQIKPKAKNNSKKEKSNEEKGVKEAVTPKHKRPEFTSRDKILLLGEGNFSFAKALADNYMDEGPENMTATCFDSEDVLYKKYGDEAKENIEYIRELGATVLFDVDATHLPKDVRKAKYTKIVFNFPHAGSGMKDQDRNVLENQKLLSAFFASVAPLLTKPEDANNGEILPEGEIHVTIKTCKPYNLWAIKGLAKATGKLAIKGTAPFYPDDFPGYEHRRTLGFKEGLSKAGNAEIISAAPKTFMFVRNEAMVEINQKSIEGSIRKKKEYQLAQMSIKVKRKRHQNNGDDDDDDD
ncbi:hypothetical protein K501DRAFT_222565 [Backusella circina FSU 941]|nr:hypothetical protein K501DRAFT_222565 [Backusella circina FSU 941]